MSVLENPFFVREVRAYSRRAWSPLSWFVLAAAILPLFPLWLDHRYGERGSGWESLWFRGLLLATIAGGHGLLCGFAGWQFGSRVFGTEHRRHTLEGLRLLSMSPWVWVLQKLVFPLYFLLLVWFAIIPGSLGLVMRGAFLPASLWPGVVLAGCAGILTFSRALIVPPERIGLPRGSERNLPLAERLEQSALNLVPAWLSWLMLKLAFVWIIAAAQDRPMDLIARSFFGRGWLQEDHAFAILLGTYAACALGCGWAWANPSSPWAIRFRAGMQLLTIGTAYAFVIGLTWEGGHWVWRAILVGVPAVQAVRIWRDRRRTWKAAKRKSIREDQSSQREITAVQVRWDNPVLIRDLRVSLRGNALLWLFLKQVFLIGLIALVMGFVVLGNPWAASTQWAFQAFAATMASILAWVSFVLAMRIGNRATVQWAGERRMNTIPQLLLSPVTGRDIVYGRWVATLLEGITVATPWIIGFGFFLVIGDSGADLGITLALCLWLFSLALLLSVASAASLRPLRHWRDCFTAHGFAMGMFIGEPLLLIWGMGASEGGGPETFVGATIALTMVNAAAIPALLWGAALNIEAYRERSLE